MLDDKVIIGKLFAISCAILYAVLLAGAGVLNTCSSSFRGLLYIFSTSELTPLHFAYVVSGPLLGSVLAQLQYLQCIGRVIFHLSSLEVFGFLILFFAGGIAADFLVFKLFICLL